MAVQYGDNCMNRRKFYEGVEIFEGGWIIKGVQWRLAYVEATDQIKYRTRDNPSISVDGIVCEMSICYGRKRYRNDLSINWKHFIFMESVHF
jgi:hypothetical protein